jgi:hypothetical protein
MFRLFGQTDEFENDNFWHTHVAGTDNFYRIYFYSGNRCQFQQHVVQPVPHHLKSHLSFHRPSISIAFFLSKDLQGTNTSP